MACRGRWLGRAVEAGNAVLIAIPEIVIALGLLAVAVRWRLVPVGVRPRSTTMIFPLGGRWKMLPVICYCRWRFSCRPAYPSLSGTCARVLLRYSRRPHVLEPVAAWASAGPFAFSSCSSRGCGSRDVTVRVVNRLVAQRFDARKPGHRMAGLVFLSPEATLARDLYLVIGGILFSALFLVGGNIAADLMLWVSDPPIRKGGLDAE